MPPPGSKDLNQSRENQDECCICYENQANTVIDSCFHGGICYECGLDLMKTKGCCYMCRKVRERQSCHERMRAASR